MGRSSFRTIRSRAEFLSVTFFPKESDNQVLLEPTSSIGSRGFVFINEAPWLRKQPHEFYKEVQHPPGLLSASKPSSGPHRSGSIADVFNREVASFGPTRGQLTSKGMIWSPSDSRQDREEQDARTHHPSVVVSGSAVRACSSDFRDGVSVFQGQESGSASIPTANSSRSE